MRSRLLLLLLLAGPVLAGAALAEAPGAAGPSGDVDDSLTAAADRLQRSLPLPPAASDGRPESPAPTAAPRMKVIPMEILPLRATKPEQRLSIADVEGDVVHVGLNKTRPLDLPEQVQDIIVARPSIADVVVYAPDRVFLAGKEVGDTNVFFLGREGKLIRRIEVNVHIDIETLKATFEEIMPAEPIEVSAVRDTVFLRGTVTSNTIAGDAARIAARFVPEDKNLVNMIKVAGEQQVLLKVRVAEMNRRVTKELNFQTAIGNGLTSAILGAGGAATMGNFSLSSLIGNLSETAPPYARGILRGTGTLSSFQATYSVLEQHGLIKTLAEPNLTSVSGDEATMLAGGEFPVPAGQDKEGNTLVVWRQVGVSVKFTPTVLSPGRISLRMAAEVSEITDEAPLVLPGVTVRGITVRRAGTTVELPSGGTLMIAGLIRNDMSASVNGVPGLMDLPVLGSLFRSTAFRNGESELVVTVTPYLVQPARAQDVLIPTDGFIVASDLDRYLLGRLQKVYSSRPQARAHGMRMPQGPVGYIVE